MPVNCLTEVDDLTRPDHYYLAREDACYYLGEYTARKGFAFSATNDLILNLKKSVDRRGRPEWRYKERAIQDAGRMFRRSIKEEWLESTATLVPVPPSKSKNDPLYDDRMLQVLREMTRGLNADVRELVLQNVSTDAAHDTDERPTPDDLIEIYEINEACTNPAPRFLVVVDDVLTTGAHFKAMQHVLAERFPGVPLVGFFVARRVPEAEDLEAIFGFSNDPDGP